MIWELVRVGIVTQVYPERGSVRVKLAGVDDFLSYEMPVVFRKTLLDYDYWMPDVEEQVLCLFLGQGGEQGFVIGSFYSQADPPPINNKNKWYKEFMDGTVIEYDRAAHKLTVTVQGDAEVTAFGNVNLTCGGDLAAQVTGAADITVTGDLTAQAANIEATATVEAKVQAATIEATATVTATITAPAITLAGAVTVQGELQVQGNVNATGQVIDSTGNTPNHSH